MNQPIFDPAVLIRMRGLFVAQTLFPGLRFLLVCSADLFLRSAVLIRMSGLFVAQTCFRGLRFLRPNGRRPRYSYTLDAFKSAIAREERGFLDAPTCEL